MQTLVALLRTGAVRISPDAAEGQKLSACAGDQPMHEMEGTMITLQDCLAFSGLDTDDMRVVAARYSLPEVVAAQGAAVRTQTAAGAAAIPRQRTERAAAEARAHG